MLQCTGYARGTSTSENLDLKKVIPNDKVNKWDKYLSK